MKLRLVAAAFGLLACGREPAPPPSAPVAVDVPPMPASASSAQVQSPPPNAEPYMPPAPAEAPAEAPTTVLTPLPSGPPGTQPFDKGRAAAALANANVQRCSVPGGPTGPGHVTVTFDPSGRVSAAMLDQGPLRGTTVGVCVERVFMTITVPPYAGGSVRVGKSFVLRP